MESKYQNGKIYKIVCNESGKIYIGSTTKSLKKRLIHHKCEYKRYLQGKETYTTSFEIIDNNNYHIELICNYPCNCRKELETMEGKYIKEIECINKNIPCRSNKEYRKQYYEQNREQKIKQQKEYYEQNREQIREQQKQYREQNREQIREYDKQRYEQNREKILQQKKEYYERMKQNKISI